MGNNEDNKWHGWKLILTYGLVIVFSIMAWIALFRAVFYLFGVKV